jgi:hypothetical protein
MLLARRAAQAASCSRQVSTTIVTRVHGSDRASLATDSTAVATQAQLARPRSQHRVQLGWGVTLFLAFVAMPLALMRRIDNHKAAHQQAALRASAAAGETSGELGVHEEEKLLAAIRDKDLAFRKRVDDHIAARKG